MSDIQVYTVSDLCLFMDGGGISTKVVKHTAYLADKAKMRDEIDALKASILEYGFTEPLIRQVSSGYVVAGAGRLMAAIELAEEGKLSTVEFTPGVRLGWSLPVVDKALSDKQAIAYCIADNRITGGRIVGRYRP